MNRTSKYIVGVYRDPTRKSGPEGKFFQEVVAIVFDPCILHADMEHVLMGVTSAGFVTIEGSDLFCSENSESLGVESNPTVDAFFVKRALGFQGYRQADMSTPPMTVEQAMDIIATRRAQKRKERHG